MDRVGALVHAVDVRNSVSSDQVVQAWIRRAAIADENASVRARDALDVPHPVADHLDVVWT